MCIAWKNDRPVVILFGPTGVGKTDLVARLFEGKGEIISVDSMQVYRGMDIGTAKPPRELRARIPHHLIDIKNPDEQYSVGEFVRAADSLVTDILSRGKLPILSGGTAFYFKHFLFGLPTAPAADPVIRSSLREELAAYGLTDLYEKLLRIDPEAGERIHAGDTYRILRALEIHRMTGKPPSSFLGPTPAAPRAGCRFFTAGLDRNRAELYARIDSRVDRMFNDGLAAEVAGLAEAGYGERAPGMQAIGYREFFIAARAGCATLRDIRDMIKRNSRRYAKRQLTFFRSLPAYTGIIRMTQNSSWAISDPSSRLPRRTTDGTFAATFGPHRAAAGCSMAPDAPNDRCVLIFPSRWSTVVV